MCQVLRGAETDTDLLAHAIEHAVDGKDFFLRKGIGWALRSLGKTRPDVVRSFLTRWQGRLSPLSVREAK